MVVVRSWLDPSPEDDLPLYFVEPPPAAGPRPPRARLDWSMVAPSQVARTIVARSQDARSKVARSRLRHPGPAPAAPRQGNTVGMGGQAPRLAPFFFQMVPLHREHLDTALNAWWTLRAKADVVTVHRRLELRAPRGNAASGWVMKGRCPASDVTALDSRRGGVVADTRAFHADDNDAPSPYLRLPAVLPARSLGPRAAPRRPGPHCGGLVARIRASARRSG